MHHRAKLTTEQIDKMREMYKKNDRFSGYTALARYFGCGISTVRDIVKLRTRAQN